MASPRTDEPQAIVTSRSAERSIFSTPDPHDPNSPHPIKLPPLCARLRYACTRSPTLVPFILDSFGTELRLSDVFNGNAKGLFRIRHGAPCHTSEACNDGTGSSGPGDESTSSWYSEQQLKETRGRRVQQIHASRRSILPLRKLFAMTHSGNKPFYCRVAEYPSACELLQGDGEQGAREDSLDVKRVIDQRRWRLWRSEKSVASGRGESVASLPLEL